MKLIDNMRKQPEEERLALAVMAAGGVGFLLFLVWGIFFFNNNSNTARVEVSGQSASASESIRQAGVGISDAVNDFSTQYDQVKRALEEAGLGEESRGKNTVDLYVDKDGDVHVDNIIVEEDELNAEE